MSRYVINRKTGTIHPTTALLMRLKHIIPAPAECVELHQKYGIQAFTLHEQANGGIVYEPVIPDAWRNPSRYGADELKANQARARIEAIEDYIKGRSPAIDVAVERRHQMGIVQRPEETVIGNDGRMRLGKVTVRSPNEALGDLEVAPDFNLDVDIRTLNKAQLLQIAAQIKGLHVNPAMKVSEIRDHINDALARLRDSKQKPAGNEAAAALGDSVSGPADPAAPNQEAPQNSSGPAAGSDPTGGQQGAGSQADTPDQPQ